MTVRRLFGNDIGGSVSYSVSLRQELFSFNRHPKVVNGHVVGRYVGRYVVRSQGNDFAEYQVEKDVRRGSVQVTRLLNLGRKPATVWSELVVVESYVNLGLYATYDKELLRSHRSAGDSRSMVNLRGCHTQVRHVFRAVRVLSIFRS